ncbi:hypothetical protein HW532_16015 [Kaustia mangrovi]|uniref:Uncharacterized protein n=1 Tax=Kaustia mangrovi TaxID=2593653 RepID=A0A7S8C638_9HYPH|nr:hypothetical protein [Kaustia mangrovi]QPC44064.1 hypothetical protein HW532_16015 [Kaustia mangrovi]
MDPATGRHEVLADGFSTPVGVVQMPDGSIVVSQYGGRLTRVAPGGDREELGASFVRPGVGILADGENAVIAVDYGGGSVRRVAFDGTATVVATDVGGSPVALGRDGDGALLVGSWGDGRIYRIPDTAAEHDASAAE